jgi:bacterial/archaeal transporter family-2 protein
MSSWMVVVMMVVSGAIMAFQGPINAGLRTHVGTFESSLISFLVGTVALVAIVAATRDGHLGQVRNVSWWQLLGGLIGAVFVTTTLLAAPKIGVTGMLVAALAGQMTAGLMIDSFGWVGMARKPIDLHRVAGLGLLGVSVVLINWNSWKKA